MTLAIVILVSSLHQDTGKWICSAAGAGSKSVCYYIGEGK